MDRMRLKRLIEALLFAAGEPVNIAQITGAIEELGRPDARSLLDELREEYDREERGFQLVEVSNGYQLASRRSYAEWVRRLFTRSVSARMSAASLETLAIVAYRQPVTRADVEEIRGVNSDSALNSLLERKLITIAGRKDVPGRPLLYGTTDAFLTHFGLKDLAELPSPEELEEMFRRPSSAAFGDLPEGAGSAP
jgi:segregation and condensation protein B